jgi:phenylacetate-CoA ligase
MRRTRCARPEYTAEYRARCLEAVEEALESVPAYRSWRRHDVGGSDVFFRLAGLPVLNKAMMRRYGPEGFVRHGRDIGAALASSEVEMVPTSGSTGDRVINAWHQPWWDASERSSWELNAHVKRAALGNHREAILSSPLCAGIPCEDGYLPMRRRTRGRFLYLNERVDPREWTPGHMARMVREIGEFKPAALEANPSYLAWLCRFAAGERLRIAAPKVLILTYENPSILHSRQIAAAIRAPLASSYGTTEAGYVFMECEHGRMHQNTEHCHVDFLPFAPRHGGPMIGSILVTTFHNPWRSLLRFDPGDVVRLAGAPCPCGRTAGLTLAGVEGRAVGLTTTLRGVAVTQAHVDRAVAGIPGIAQYQLVQLSPRGFRFSYAVLEPGAGVSAELALRNALAGIYGSRAEIRVKQVAAIAPDPPGKYRLTKRFEPVVVASLLDRRRAGAG